MVFATLFSDLVLYFFVGFLLVGTLPALYERHEAEVDYLVSKGIKDLKRLLEQFDSNILSKIPRGQVKQKKRN